MKKAGGILGLIGGVFGVFAAIVTLFVDSRDKLSQIPIEY